MKRNATKEAKNILTPITSDMRLMRAIEQASRQSALRSVDLIGEMGKYHEPGFLGQQDYMLWFGYAGPLIEPLDFEYCSPHGMNMPHFLDQRGTACAENRIYFCHGSRRKKDETGSLVDVNEKGGRVKTLLRENRRGLDQNVIPGLESPTVEKNNFFVISDLKTEGEIRTYLTYPIGLSGDAFICAAIYVVIDGKLVELPSDGENLPQPEAIEVIITPKFGS